GIGLSRVGEREDVGRIEEVEEGMSVARGLRETMIEAAAARACHVGHDAVEDLAIAFVSIESVIEIRAKKTAALRDAERERAIDRPFRNRDGIRGSVFQERDRVPDRRGSESHDR